MARKPVRVDDWPELRGDGVRVIGGQWAETPTEPTYVDTVDEQDPWFAYRLYFSDSRLIELRIGFMTVDAPRRIGAADLRKVNLGEHERTAVRFLRAGADRFGDAYPDATATTRARLAAHRRPGRAGRPASDLAAIAASYVEHLNSGRSAKQCAASFPMAISTLYENLRKATADGLLEGYPGPMAALTDQARRLLGAD